MALLSETELVDKRQLLSRRQHQAAVATGQMLPGATGVSIAANLGYHLRGLPGALIAVGSYLIPALTLVLIFAMVYFNAPQSSDMTARLDGLTATLGGLILANAVQLGKRHSRHALMWLVIGLAFVIQFVFHLNPLLLLTGFGLAGLAYHLAQKRQKDTRP